MHAPLQVLSVSVLSLLAPVYPLSAFTSSISRERAGMVEAGQRITDTRTREFGEEAMAMMDASDEAGRKVSFSLEIFGFTCFIVASGY
jgi:hypothetical protein